MTHASLYREGKAVGKFVKPHGKEFQLKIRELNRALSINITTKHRYMSWFRCDGKCRENESCLFGYVSSSVSCLKAAADLALHKCHQTRCGGTFREAEEPAKNVLKAITKRWQEMKSTRAKKMPSKQKVNQAVIKFLSNRKSVDYITTDDEV